MGPLPAAPTRGGPSQQGPIPRRRRPPRLRRRGGRARASWPIPLARQSQRSSSSQSAALLLAKKKPSSSNYASQRRVISDKPISSCFLPSRRSESRAGATTSSPDHPGHGVPRLCACLTYYYPDHHRSSPRSGSSARLGARTVSSSHAPYIPAYI
jgi:hypothetical protein